jgi:hypothetical protein
MLHPKISEIAKRLERQSVIRFTKESAMFEFSRIHASQAKDYDGTPCNWPLTDVRNPIQLRIVRDGKATYTNYW